MKHYFYLILTVLALSTLTSCKSQEEKALELIKGEMFKTLLDFESYQPIETKIDSAFTEAVNDTTIISKLLSVIVAKDLFEEAMKEFDDALESMKLWTGSFSAYGRSRFQEANNKATEKLDAAKKYEDLREQSEKEAAALIKALPREFTGWKVTHTYRCKNRGGQPAIGTNIYYIDPKFKEVQYSYDAEDEDYIKVTKLIEELKKATPEESGDATGSEI